MKNRIIFVILVSILALCITPFLGAIPLSFMEVFTDSRTQLIFVSLRIPRVILGFVIGGGLALCGLCFQAILKNPLAEPYTLGVASGSALGAAIFIHFGWSFSFLFMSGLTISSMIGALLTMTVLFSQYRVSIYPFKLLLFGIIINFFCGSLMSLLQALGSMNDNFRLGRWMMGSLENASASAMWLIAPIIFILNILIWILSPRLNLLATGVDIAKSRGVNIITTLRLFYCLVGLMIGFMVSFCGPIGFIGLIIPHFTRLLFGTDHKLLCPIAFLLGGCLLVLADTAARTLFSPAEIPVGIITALIGAPFFAWALSRK